MIEDITIHNLGVIKDARLAPGPGLTVLTGETGAGKTMVLTSVGLLLGRKADPAQVRAGEDTCVIEGVFVEPEDGPAHRLLADAGGFADEDALMVSRTVPKAGRSRAVAGGRAVPAGLLAEMGSHLVTIHGQADQLSLRSTTEQRRLLDAAGSPAHRDSLAAYGEAWDAWRAAEAALADAQRSQAERDREKAVLEVGLDLAETLAPLPGEDETLLREIDRLANVEDLRVAATQAHGALTGGEGGDCVSLLGEAQRVLDRVGDLDSQLGEQAVVIRDSARILQDCGSFLASYLDDLAADPAELAAKQQRLADLRRAIGPYAADVDGFLAWTEQAAARLAELDDPDRSIDALLEQVEATRAALVEAGETLTKSRLALAGELEEAVATELAGLAMTDAGFTIQVSPMPPQASGADEVTFGLRDREGRLRGLGQGASGGELSRIMLALEAALIDRHPPTGRPTLIFDEVDAGIGGATASAIGQRLARLAERYQVIVVTHLAQVAAFASTHLVVARDGDTTTLRIAEGEARIGEIARMLSGHVDSDAARAHAAELLSQASVA